MGEGEGRFLTSITYKLSEDLRTDMHALAKEKV